MKQTNEVSEIVKSFIGEKTAVVGVAINLLQRYPQLQETLPAILTCYLDLVRCFEAGNQLFICGNGGSFSDAMHMSTELMKAFNRRRKLTPEDVSLFNELPYGNEISNSLEYGFPVTVLGLNHALKSAIENDIPVPYIGYAQELFTFGKNGDLFLGISTSGKAKNVIYAAITAKVMGMKTIALTGHPGGELASIVDLPISVPESTTHYVQEFHLPIYHTICEMVEAHNFHEKR
jgi:D-sedoheptulose 7-phosphate isomerase